MHDCMVDIGALSHLNMLSLRLSVALHEGEGGGAISKCADHACSILSGL